MSDLPFVSEQDLTGRWTWRGACDAIREGHIGAQADIGDTLITQNQNSLLVRSAWLPEIACGVKVASVFPDKDPKLSKTKAVQSICILFDPSTGDPKALIDGNLVTKIKTAADSVLGAELLARENSETLTILGAGVVAASLIDAYIAVFPNIKRILIWNRTHASAQRLAEAKNSDRVVVEAINDLEQALTTADMISSATMSKTPFIKGNWIKSGTHVDLIGAFAPDMREADDELVRRGEIFVDSRKTAIDDIGELKIPIANVIICRDDIRGDFYDLCPGKTGRSNRDAITIFKNGGGGHMDLMIANYLLSSMQH